MAVSEQKLEKDRLISSFSKEHDVDFAGWIFRWDLYTEGDSHGYEPSYPLNDALDVLNISSNDRIIDLGCGKGYAMYLFSKYCFGRIDGVEKCETLSSIAIANMNTLFPMSTQSFHIYTEDVNNWNQYINYNFFYLCNPFGIETTISVAKHIQDVAKVKNSTVTVIYQIYEFLDVFIDLGYEILFKSEMNCVLQYSVHI